MEFYSSRYSSNNEEKEALVEEFCMEMPQVSAEANSQLDRPLQLDKLHAAVQTMRGRKAPGVDGPTTEFYKAFWDIVAHNMEVLNESLASGSLPLSCRRAIVTLLPKKGNLQDYKILSKPTD